MKRILILQAFICCFGWMSFNPSTAFAISECRVDSDCGRNYVCRSSSNGERVCVWDSYNECSGNGDCPSGSMCISGRCSDGNPGDSCSGNGDCSTGYMCCSGSCELSHCRSREVPQFQFE